jgi:hypothetical protein
VGGICRRRPERGARQAMHFWISCANVVTSKLVSRANLDKKKIGHASCPVEAPTQLKRSGSQASGKGPAEYFTGTVRIDPLFEAADPAQLASVSRSNSALEQHGIPIHWAKL